MKWHILYTKLYKIQYMNRKDKSTYCTVNSEETCISTKLSNRTYGKLEKN